MKLSLSLSQNPPVTSVYGVNQLLKNEAKIAQSQHIAIYGLMQSTGSAVLPSY